MKESAARNRPERAVAATVREAEPPPSTFSSSVVGAAVGVSVGAAEGVGALVGALVGCWVGAGTSAHLGEIFTTAVLDPAQPTHASTVPELGMVTERLLESLRVLEHVPPEMEAPPLTSKRYLRSRGVRV